MNILLVDDEALARRRLRQLLADIEPARHAQVDEAADADAARALLRGTVYDLVLLDIQMPDESGLSLAAEIARAPAAPAVVFVTAHEEHALEAFEHGAHDYLTKPVRAQRLQQALLRVLHRRAAAAAPAATAAPALAIVERGALLRVPLGEVLYCRAQDKYTLVCTAARSYLSEQSLGELEQRFGQHFVRTHRSALVARHAIARLERADDAAPAPQAGEAADSSGWVLRLRGATEGLPVSRRQLPLLRALLRADP